MKSGRKKNCSVNVGRWISYAAAGAATAVAASNDTEGAILYSGVLNQAVGHAAGVSSRFIKTLIANSVQGANKLGTIHHSLIGAPAPGGGYNSSSAVGKDNFLMRGAVNGRVAGNRGSLANPPAVYPYAYKLAFGANLVAIPLLPVGTNATMVSGGYDNANAHWFGVGTGFLGFKFNNGAGDEYGWARVTINHAQNWRFTLVDYAYGTVGQAITAGQTATPEPASLALLAVGAVGLLALRKKSNKARAALPESDILVFRATA